MTDLRTIKTVHNNGIIFQEYTTIFNKQYGKHREYKRHGMYREYSCAGYLELQCHYVNGILDGEYLQWGWKGMPRVQRNYHQGEICGEALRFQYDGTIHYRGFILHDLPIGEEKCCGIIERNVLPGPSFEWTEEEKLLYNLQYPEFKFISQPLRKIDGACKIFKW